MLSGCDKCNHHIVSNAANINMNNIKWHTTLGYDSIEVRCLCSDKSYILLACRSNVTYDIVDLWCLQRIDQIRTFIYDLLCNS